MLEYFCQIVMQILAERGCTRIFWSCRYLESEGRGCARILLLSRYADFDRTSVH